MGLPGDSAVCDCRYPDWQSSPTRIRCYLRTWHRFGTGWTRQAMKGRFITFEGGEGVGKSTQIRRLATSLAGLGIETLLTREPGGSPHAEKLREVLLSGGAKPFGAFAETILFNAARDDHLEVTIRPTL